MAKNAKMNKTGMTDTAKAEWRATKSSQLNGRVAALKKLNEKPPTPKRAHPAPADAPTVAEVAGPAPALDVVPDAAERAIVTPTAPVGDGGSGAAAAAQDPHGGKTDKPKRARKAPGERKPRTGGGGCLNIAAKVLADSKEPMTTKALIETMAAKGLWTSPGGKTPAATLYAAIVREIRDKGDSARFRKMDRGLFAAKM